MSSRLDTLTDESLPRADVGTLPTPVERADDLAAALGVGSGDSPGVGDADALDTVDALDTADARNGSDTETSDLYVKRDDLTGEVYGGNKVRKLAFLLGDAERRGIEDVWTIGSLGSNHVLATCLYARERSLVPHAIQFPEPVDESVRRTLRVLSTTEPELELLPDADAAFAAGDRREREFRESEQPDFYYVPPGGATPVGELGFVDAALELREQIDAGDCPEPDSIVVPVGSGGTLAGLACGCRLAGIESDLVGVRTAMRSFGNAERVAELARDTADLLADYGVDAPRVSPADVSILHDYVGDGYGEPSAAGAAAAETAAEHGLSLDPTFTAKTVAGLADADRFRGETVLYWHTYNSRDLSDRVARANVRATLPESYRRFFPELSE